MLEETCKLMKNSPESFLLGFQGILSGLSQRFKFNALLDHTIRDMSPFFLPNDSSFKMLFQIN